MICNSLCCTSGTINGIIFSYWFQLASPHFPLGILDVSGYLHCISYIWHMVCISWHIPIFHRRDCIPVRRNIKVSSIFIYAASTQPPFNAQQPYLFHKTQRRAVAHEASGYLKMQHAEICIIRMLYRILRQHPAQVCVAGSGIDKILTSSGFYYYNGKVVSK